MFQDTAVRRCVAVITFICKTSVLLQSLLKDVARKLCVVLCKKLFATDLYIALALVAEKPCLHKYN